MRNRYIDEYDDIEWLKSLTFYHGTSTAIQIPHGILKPSYETGTIREKELRQVYITTSIGSAKRYAYKATDRFGGEPIVYVVRPDFDTLINRIDCEYVCDFAEIVAEV